jgi:hypothetical protein
MSSGTKGSTIETKSDFVVNSDEEKHEVGQGQEGNPQVPEQQNLLEVSCRRRRYRLHLLRSTAFHQPTIGHQFRGTSPVLMGDCWRHLPILSSKWRPSINGVWRHPGLLRRQRHFYVSRRAGLNVCILLLQYRHHLTSSSDPIVGAQYRWSAHFAPSNPKFWGLLQGTCLLVLSTTAINITTIGWLTVSAWIFGLADITAELANNATALIIFNKDDYVYHRWHTTMLMWVFIIIPLVFNLYFRRLLNTIETIGAIIHVTFFIASIATLVTLTRHSTNQFVWNTIVNDISGWTNPGVSFGLGLLTMTVPLVGADALLHMSIAP